MEDKNIYPVYVVFIYLFDSWTSPGDMVMLVASSSGGSTVEHIARPGATVDNWQNTNKVLSTV